MEETGPRGFRVHTDAVGLADGGRDDLTVIASEIPAAVSAMFTRSRFAGPSVQLSRQAAADGVARGVVVLATNANVATGAAGLTDAEEVRRTVAERIGVEENDLLIASTGIIGRRYPMRRIRPVLATLPWPFPGRDFDRAARAIMTTDTRPKRVTYRIGEATLVGIAKGVGMIEPDMATMLAYFCTDAAIPADELDAIFRPVVERTLTPSASTPTPPPATRPPSSPMDWLGRCPRTSSLSPFTPPHCSWSGRLLPTAKVPQP